MPNTSKAFANLRRRSVAGGVAGNLACPGIKKTDALVSVVNQAAAGADLVGEFTISADDQINNTAGTNTTGMVLSVMWEVTGGGRQGGRGTGRSQY